MKNYGISTTQEAESKKPATDKRVVLKRRSSSSKITRDRKSGAFNVQGQCRIWVDDACSSKDLDFVLTLAPWRI